MTSAIARHEALDCYVPERRRSSRPYQDLHEHVATLAEKGLLYVVDQPVNKDTEMHPLVRWQYRGGLFTLTMHPQASGRPSRALMLRSFIQYVKSLKDVWITSPAELVKYWRSEHPPAPAATA